MIMTRAKKKNKPGPESHRCPAHLDRHCVLVEAADVIDDDGNDKLVALLVLWEHHAACSLQGGRAHRHPAIGHAGPWPCHLLLQLLSLVLEGREHMLIQIALRHTHKVSHSLGGRALQQ